MRLARIGVFELDFEARELRRSGRLVALTGQPMRVLLKLVERAGEVVSREELQREIWGEDTHVDFEAGLSTCVNQVRTALGDRAASPRFVETLPRRGFRFVAPVEWLPDESAAAAVPATVPRRGPWIAACLVLILLVLSAGLLVRRAASSSPSPVPIAVFSVDVDARTPELQPVSFALTDTLIGALVTEAGARARVASPLVSRELRDAPFPAIVKSGIDYVVLVTLRSAGERVLVHVKLVDRTGFVRWTSDRTLPLDQLQREQIALSGELSKQLVREIFRGDVTSI